MNSRNELGLGESDELTNLAVKVVMLKLEHIESKDLERLVSILLNEIYKRDVNFEQKMQRPLDENQ